MPLNWGIPVSLFKETIAAVAQWLRRKNACALELLGVQCTNIP